MAKVKGMEALHHGHGRRSFGVPEVRQRISSRAFEALGAFWPKIVPAILDRHIVCHIAAFSFCFFVLAPAIIIGGSVYGDRSLPFEYIKTAFTTSAAFPNQQVQIRFVTGEIHSFAKGEFDRIFYDGCNKPWPLGTHPTEYDKSAKIGEAGAFYKNFTIPEGACPGDATYVTKPRFWHNEIQGALKPIIAPVQTTSIRVLALPGPIPNRDHPPN